MKPVANVPPLPYPGRASDVNALAAFDQDLTKSLYMYFVEIATRVNQLLPKDGTEPMTGNLDMGAFGITNVEGLNFGSRTAASPQDLSRHIALWGTSYGFSITGSQLNFVVPDSADFVWYNGSGTQRMRLDNATGMLTHAYSRLTSNGDISLASTNHAFQIGDDTGVNLAIDTNEIQGRNNGAASALALNAEGGTVTIGNAAAGGALQLNSGQLNFPATQIPSTGANVLDDYEEGSWTPTVTASTPGNIAVTYATRLGRYNKVGKKVTVWFVVTTATFTHTTASGELRLSGLPFANELGSEAIGTADVNQVTFPASRTSLTSNIQDGQSHLRFVATGGGSRNAIQMTNTTTGTNISLLGSITYEASA